MSSSLDQDKPIYIQIREKIEDQIMNRLLEEDQQAPSTNQLTQFYKINHATVSKGINQLVDEGILYKKRGIGMFVAAGAREKLIHKRKQVFIQEDLAKLVQDADTLGITEAELIRLIKNVKGSDTQ